MPDRTRLVDGATSPRLFERVESWGEETLDPAWCKEITPYMTDLSPVKFRPSTRKAPKQGDPARAFQLAFLGRMLFSCLVDADFKDTADFYAKTDGCAIDRTWPVLAECLPALRVRFDDYIAKLPTNSDVNRLRADILAHIRGNASKQPGVFTVTVPTGGGKTLATLGLALDHASVHQNFRRIIYVAPFTSIIDQTASIYRAVLGGANWCLSIIQRLIRKKTATLSAGTS